MSCYRTSAGTAVVLTLAATLGAGPRAMAQETPPDPAAVEARPFFFALSVQDVDASRAWYERVFGFCTVRSTDVEARGLRIRLLARKGAFLELAEIATARDASDLDPALERRHLLRGVFKIGFAVAGLDEALARLEALGVEPRGDPVTEPDGSMRSAQIEDPDGNVLQLFELL